MVERYEYEHFHESWIAIEDGEWVKYEDYAKLEAENQKLRGELAIISMAKTTGSMREILHRFLEVVEIAKQALEDK